MGSGGTCHVCKKYHCQCEFIPEPEMLLRRISDTHWTLGGNHIRKSDCFGFSGWYWDRVNTVFPPVKDSFLDVLVQIMEEEIDTQNAKQRNY